MPEMSEMITSFFTGNTPTTVTEKQKEKSKAIKSSKKSNKSNQLCIKEICEYTKIMLRLGICTL